MAKDPAFLFYTSDFLTGTMFLSHEQTGIYIRLLCSQHQHGGIIDKVSFNSLVGTHDILRAKFIETETGFYNERLAIEVDLRAKKSSNMSQTAKEVWEKRKQERALAEQKKNKRNTNVQKNDTNVLQTEDVNEDVNTNENKGLKLPYTSELFLENWKILTGQKKWNKKSAAALQASLNILAKETEQDAIQMMQNSIAGEWQGLFPLTKKPQQPTEQERKPKPFLQKP